ncbi:hypothetical protein AB0P17_10995 [Streptomyces sp. NPDC088124]|uniref:hypothetical protein n=1 Tax=Streptomyces sp. NPDC088124 TaxID=3154654 RepID=UPI0034416032
MSGGKQVLLAEPRSLCAGVRRAVCVFSAHGVSPQVRGNADTSVTPVATEDIVFSPPSRLTGAADVP